MSFALRLRNDKRVRWALAGSGAAAVVYYLASPPAEPKTSSAECRPASSSSSSSNSKVNRNLVARQLRVLLPILMPGWFSYEARLLYGHTGMLVARTFISLYVARLDGALVKHLVSRNPRGFLAALAKWFAVAVPASFVNSMIKYLESKLALAFRTRLSRHCYRNYMAGDVYYSVTNLDDRLANPDQCLTDDIANFCNNLAHIHSQISKPLLDVVLSSIELIRMGRNRRIRRGSGDGMKSTLYAGFVAIAAIWGSNKLLRLARPPFGKMVAEQAKREGELRFAHSRLITNAEEIAFYRGHAVEHSILWQKYDQLTAQLQAIFKARVPYTLLESFLMKYTWSASGMIMLAIPVFLEQATNPEVDGNDAENVSDRTGDFITSKKLLLQGAEAIERMMLALKEISELAGYASRVTNMIEVFDDAAQGHTQKSLVDGADAALMRGVGVVRESEILSFKDVPIVTPNGDVLVDKISFCIRPGDHIIITGPNGCGKSSLFRIIGGLWPVRGGTVTKPAVDRMFYIPQRPYLVIGSLRDQVIYPDSRDDMLAKGLTDENLEAIFGWVALENVVRRESKGWDSVRDWKDVLSGGEKQRVGMARTLYHKPLYAILDECTSAVSIDVEDQIYQRFKDVGITLITVSHRPTLWKHHRYLLQFDGEGGFCFAELGENERQHGRRIKGGAGGPPEPTDMSTQELAEASRAARVRFEMLQEQLRSRKPDTPQSVKQAQGRAASDGVEEAVPEGAGAGRGAAVAGRGRWRGGRGRRKGKK